MIFHTRGNFVLECLLISFEYLVLSDKLSTMCLLLATGYVGMDGEDSIITRVQPSGVGEQPCGREVGGGG